jgi:hypothetical protein
VTNRCDGIRSVLLAAMSLMTAAAPAFAAKADLVVLRNGDHFTGDVKQLSRGQLKLSTDDAGTIYIEWDKIVGVTTVLPYEVVVRNGTRYVGVLAPASATQLNVVAENGTVTTLSFLDVVSFASIKEGFLERIDGTLDVGGSYTKSSGVGQLNAALDAAYRRPSYNVFTNALSTVTRQNGSATITQFTLRSGYMHFADDGWILSPFAYVARNVDLGLSLVTAGALTAGRYLQRSNRAETLVAGGAAVGREELVDGRTIHDVDAVASVAAAFYRHDYPRTAVDLSLLMFPELNRWGRVRANAYVRLKRELFRDFIAAITAYDTVDTRPQVVGVSRNDVGVSLSIGWMF